MSGEGVPQDGDPAAKISAEHQRRPVRPVLQNLGSVVIGVLILLAGVFFLLVYVPSDVMEVVTTGPIGLPASAVLGLILAILHLKRPLEGGPALVRAGALFWVWFFVLVYVPVHAVPGVLLFGGIFALARARHRVGSTNGKTQDEANRRSQPR